LNQSSTKDDELKKNAGSIWADIIQRDLDRTFPEHPFYNKAQYGEIGQKYLERALLAYSVYNEKAGYC
jgi:hypothetical protein